MIDIIETQNDSGRTPVEKKRQMQGYYRRLRRKIDQWTQSGEINHPSGCWTDNFVQYLLVLPDLVALLIRMFLDKNIPKPVKGYIVMMFAYLLSPIDIIPDFIPVAGFVDDLLVVALVLNKVINEGLPELHERIRLHWEGQDDVFEKIREIVSLVHRLSSHLPRRLAAWLEPPAPDGRVNDWLGLSRKKNDERGDAQ